MKNGMLPMTKIRPSQLAWIEAKRKEGYSITELIKMALDLLMKELG